MIPQWVTTQLTLSPIDLPLRSLVNIDKITISWYSYISLLLGTFIHKKKNSEVRYPNIKKDQENYFQ